MFNFANTFLQKFNRINLRQFPLLPSLSFVQTTLCRKQQRSSHCFRLKLKIKTFYLCFLLNTIYLHPEQVIKVFFQPITAVVTCFLPKLPALSCHHPPLPLSSWLALMVLILRAHLVVVLFRDHLFPASFCLILLVLVPLVLP